MGEAKKGRGSESLTPNCEVHTNAVNILNLPIPWDHCDYIELGLCHVTT